MVAHSLVEAPKTQTVMDAYNRRSIECRIATALISHALVAQYGGPEIEFMGDLIPEKIGLSEEGLQLVVERAVEEKPYSIADIASQLGITSDEVIKKWCMRNDGSFFPLPSKGFLLYQRLQHVLTEWARVNAAYDSLQNGDMLQLGKLMDASHASCRDLHQISCPELDMLTEISRKAGAIGSRLTGAGFGGCTISLVPNELLDTYVKEIGKRYYRDQMQRKTWRDMIFIVRPESGAKRLM